MTSLQQHPNQFIPTTRCTTAVHLVVIQAMIRKMILRMEFLNRYHTLLLLLFISLITLQNGIITSLPTKTTVHAFTVVSYPSTASTGTHYYTPSRRPSTTRMETEQWQQRTQHIPLQSNTLRLSIRNKESHSFSTSTSSSALSMFLPPGGDGDNNSNNSELKELTSTILTFFGIVAFFVSPLGGIFFTLFNSFIAFLILAPIGLFMALNIWEYFNTITGVCPNCQAPIKVLKNETPTICYNCGSIVQAKDGNVYLANPKNQNNMYGNGAENLSPMNRNMFSTIFEEITTVLTNNDDDPNDDNGTQIQSPRSSSSPSTATSNKNRNKNTIIDVDVINED